MIDRTGQSTRLNLFKPAKSESGIIELPNVPGMVDSKVFAEDGRVISAERVPAIKQAIDQVTSQGSNKNQEQIYIHKRDFPEDMEIKHSFIRIGATDYVVIKEVIGKGQQENTVLLAQNIETGELGVLKKIKMSGTAEEQQKAEISIGREVKALHEIENSPKMPVRKKSKNDINYGYIFMQLAKGIELTDLLENERSRDIGKTVICRPMISPLVRIQLGLNLLQQEMDLAAKGYWHLDLKPRNVMVDVSKQLIKLIDFGMAQRMDADKNVVLGFITGTDVFLSPEIRALAASEPASAESVVETKTTIPGGSDTVSFEEKSETALVENKTSTQGRRETIPSDEEPESALVEHKTDTQDGSREVIDNEKSETALVEDKTSTQGSREAIPSDEESETALVEHKTPTQGGIKGVTYNEKSEVYALGLILAELFGLYDLDAAYECNGKPIPEWLDTKFINPDKSKNNDNIHANRSIPRDALLAVLDLVLAMTADEPHRIGLDESYKRLEEIKKTYFKNAVVKIGLIDVEEYTKLNPDEKKAFLKQFAEVKTFTDDKKRPWQERAFDEILLVDSSGTIKDVFYYLNVKREIEKAFEVTDIYESDEYFNLVVANDVIVPRQDLGTKVTKYLEERELPTQCVPAKPLVEQEAKSQVGGPGKSATSTNH